MVQIRVVQIVRGLWSTLASNFQYVRKETNTEKPISEFRLKEMGNKTLHELSLEPGGEYIIANVYSECKQPHLSVCEHILPFHDMLDRLAAAMPFGENVLVVRYEDVLLDMRTSLDIIVKHLHVPEPYASKVIEDFMSKEHEQLGSVAEEAGQHLNGSIPGGHFSSRARERDFISTIRKNTTFAMHLDRLDARMQKLFPCRTSNCEQHILEDIRT